MIISPKYKFIFLKTQKTAGSSIEKVLLEKISDDDNLVFGGMPPENMKPINLPEYLEHATIHVGETFIKSNYPLEWNSFFKFTVERNSWDKVVSLYYWGQHLKPNSPRFCNGFDHFVLHSKPSPYLKDWESYTNRGKIAVDQVMQYDTLHEDFKDVMDFLRIPYHDELLNTRLKSGHRTEQNYRSLYSDQSREHVYKLYRNPIEYFNYQF